ncbi:hypothetical protein V2J09_014366 [Rumex salicifolius]
MSRNLSPVVRRELANLKKDADSRKSAMKALKSYVKDLDSKAIPFFLAQVSDTKNGGSSGEYTISLYEVLARVHGPNIVSQIDMIMGTIIRTLAASAGSFPLQQACSKVVPAIARYAIEPSTPEDKKRRIIHSLCKPLSDSLLCSQETLSCGAALCLKALVDCDNWRFASDEVVNGICLKLAGALKDKVTQTNSHMGLVMSLAKRNSLVVEAYVGLYIQSGLEILNAGEKNSQKRFSAIQMINFLMKCLDIRSTYSELELIIEEMEKCQSDQMPYVSGAAFEALQIAKKLMAEEAPKFNGRGRYHSASGDQSPSSGSPESQVLDSMGDYDSLMDSPNASSQASCNVESKMKSVNRKLWSYQNGGVDISLKDGIFSEIVRSGGSCAFSELSEASDLRCYTNGFNGFYTETPANGGSRSQTPSPQRTHSHINADNIKIYSTPRKLVRSLQDQDEDSTDFYKNQARIFKSPTSVIKYSSNELSDGFINTNKIKERFSNKGDQSQSGTKVVTDENCPVEKQVNVGEMLSVEPSQEVNKCKKAVKISGLKTAFYVFFAVLMAMFALFSSVSMLGNEQEGRHLVPT